MNGSVANSVAGLAAAVFAACSGDGACAWNKGVGLVAVENAVPVGEEEEVVFLDSWILFVLTMLLLLSLLLL